MIDAIISNLTDQFVNKLASAIAHRAILILGLGAVLVSMSEYWFYQVDAEVDSVLILMAYGLLGYLFIAVLQSFRIHSVPGLMVAAALLGFLIEGVPVPVVYAHPPLSILWTSLAWHAVISIGLGWLVLRFVMATCCIWIVIAMNVGLGVLLGGWNAFMWNAHEVERAGEFVFRWQPTDVFAEQFLFGYALFLGGHILLDKLYPRRLFIHRFEHLGLWLVACILSVMVAIGSGLLALYPVLPALVIVCLVALRREAKSSAKGSDTIIDQLYENPVPLWRFGLTALIPAFAIPIYTVLVQAEVETEMNAVLILITGPLSLALLLWSLIRIARAPKQAALSRRD